MLGTLISAGSSLLSGILGNKASKDANDANAKMQKEAAQNQVQWRVADANKAGVSPLVALGMSPISMSPSYVGNDSMASAVGNMGQDIGRAVTAKMGPQERVSAVLTKLQVERGQLENDLLRSQIRRLNSPGTPPGIAGQSVVDGQGDVPVIDLKPPQKTTHVVLPGGRVIERTAGTDAQTAEDAWGEGAGSLMGFGNMLRDIFPDWYAEMDRPYFRKPGSASRRGPYN